MRQKVIQYIEYGGPPIYHTTEFHTVLHAIQILQLFFNNSSKIVGCWEHLYSSDSSSWLVKVILEETSNNQSSFVHIFVTELGTQISPQGTWKIVHPFGESMEAEQPRTAHPYHHFENSLSSIDHLMTVCGLIFCRQLVQIPKYSQAPLEQPQHLTLSVLTCQIDSDHQHISPQ